MPPARWPLTEALVRLRQEYGAPLPLPVRDPFELVLWECCAYLVDDARRAKVYARLVKATRGEPRRIAAMKRGALAVLITADGGMHPELRAEKLQRAANLALEWGLETLRALCQHDPASARKLLKQLPGIGDPGADRILMIAGTLRTLAPDSNGTRVLVRLGFGKREVRYDRMYRSVVEATEPELPIVPAALLRGHLLLRQHGKTLCKANAPRCAECPLEARCLHAQR
jgi:endonuclease III